MFSDTYAKEWREGVEDKNTITLRAVWLFVVLRASKESCERFLLYPCIYNISQSMPWHARFRVARMEYVFKGKGNCASTLLKAQQTRSKFSWGQTVMLWQTQSVE